MSMLLAFEVHVILAPCVQFCADFRRRFTSLLRISLHELPCSLALSLLDPNLKPQACELVAPTAEQAACAKARCAFGHSYAPIPLLLAISATVACCVSTALFSARPV